MIKTKETPHSMRPVHKLCLSIDLTPQVVFNPYVSSHIKFVSLKLFAFVFLYIYFLVRWP